MDRQLSSIKSINENSNLPCLDFKKNEDSSELRLIYHHLHHIIPNFSYDSVKNLFGFSEKKKAWLSVKLSYLVGFVRLMLSSCLVVVEPGAPANPRLYGALFYSDW